MKGEKGADEDEDDTHGSGLVRSAVGASVLDSLLVPVQEKDHGAPGPDHEVQIHKVSCGEYDYNYKPN